MKYCKPIDIEDFDLPELRPYLLEFAAIDAKKFGLSEPVIIPDSKQWEGAMALYTLDKHGCLGAGKMVAGIGAGLEVPTHLIAKRGCTVFPTDRYLEATPWSDVAPRGYMVDPQIYTDVPLPLGSVIPVSTDARVLRLPDNFFDAVYSSGSIEHFGGLDSVASASAQIGRVLKPGGYASLTTEFWLDGPTDRPWFDDNCILFTPDLIAEHIVKASGLELVNPIDGRPSPATFATRQNLADFLARAVNVKTLRDKQALYPNLVLYHDGFLLCSVHLLLRKPDNWQMPERAQQLAAQFAPVIARQNQIALKTLNKMPTATFLTADHDLDGDTSLKGRVKAVGLRAASFVYGEITRRPAVVNAIKRGLRASPKLHDFARRILRRVRYGK